MPKLSRIEIDEALEEYRQAQAAIDQADPDFVEAAVYRQKAAECQLDALVRQAKVIQFPLARCESEVEESCRSPYEPDGKSSIGGSGRFRIAAARDPARKVVGVVVNI